MGQLTKHRNDIQLTDTEQESIIFSNIAQIIEKRKFNAVSVANGQIVLMFWEVGTYINSVILGMERAEYGKKILSTVSTKLVATYGNPFVEANLYRMKRFATVFGDIKAITNFIPFLSWSHFCEIMRIKDEQARLYYAKNAAERQLGIRELRQQIARKPFERQEIANTQLTEDSKVPFNVFKDPYLSSLFFHRDLRRLVAIDLKTGRFKPKYKGQMELYLKWLDRYERKEGENSPVGLILCTEASRNQIELLELDKAGIAVAEYWTNLPPKNLLEKKIQT